jgi:spermidine/putrescine-binding protein
MTEQPNRRNFLKYAATGAIGAALGAGLTYAGIGSNVARPTNSTVTSTVTAPATGGGASGPGTLNIDTSGGAFRTVLEQVAIPKFEQMYADRGWKCNILETGSGTPIIEAAQLAKKSGATPAYDLTDSWDQSYEALAVPQGLTNSMDYNNIPNSAEVVRNINPMYLGYGVPRMINIPCYGVNTDQATKLGVKVDELQSQGWEALWRPEFKGHLGLFAPDHDAATLLIMNLQTYAGGDPADPTLEKGFEVFEKNILPMKPIFSPGSSDMNSKFQSGQVWAGQIYDGRAYTLKAGGLPVDFLLFSNPYPLHSPEMMETFVNTPMKEAAEKFISLLITPEICAATSKLLHYQTVNVNVNNFLTQADQAILTPVSVISRLPVVDNIFWAQNRAAWVSRLQKDVSQA